MINLGTLKEITDLRSIWPHEALNFTPWVAENVELLADAVGFDITVDETESSVGDFNVDIYASETGTDRKIIIENQLEDTDHDHLGQHRRKYRISVYIASIRLLKMQSTA